MNTISPNKMSRLIVSYMDGNLSDEDRKILQQWIDKSEENNNLFRKLTSPEFINNIAHKKEDLEKDMAFEWMRLRNEIQRKQRLRKLTYRIVSSAAVLLLLLCFGSIFDFQNLSYKEPFSFIVNEPPVLPGSSKAILQLADGKEVLLNSDSVVYMLKNKQVLVNKNDTIPVAITAKEELAYNTIIVPRGGEYMAMLEDGSKIYLNSDSRIKIPIAFEEHSRKLIFEKGEAYFEVARDKTRPFVVDINGTSIKVLGTEFNVRAHPSEHAIVTTLVEGSINLSQSTGSFVTLTPGQQAQISEGTDFIKTEYVNTYPYVAWKNGRIVFENQKLGIIMEELSRWYNLEIFYEGVDAQEFRFTIDILKYKNLNEILKLFEEMDKVRFEIKDKNLTITRLN